MHDLENIVIPYLSLNLLTDSTNTASSASYLELHPETMTVRFVSERNYLTKEMVPQDVSSDFPYAYLISYFHSI